MKARALVLFIMLCLASMPALAGEGAITKFGKWLDGSGKQCAECPKCPAYEPGGAICPDTPVEKLTRPWFELGFNLDAFESPAGGSPQFNFANYSLVGVYNLSPVFYLYGSYSARTVEKIKYQGSVYDATWSYQTVIAGAGFYLRPTIKVFGGLGKVVPKNAEGSEELTFAIERGITWDIPLNRIGYKFAITFRSIEAGLANEDAHIAASQADGSTNVLSVGLFLPIGGM